MSRLAAELALLDDLRSSYEKWLATPAAPDVPAPLLAAGAKELV
jgi:hypothetical protein